MRSVPVGARQVASILVFYPNFPPPASPSLVKSTDLCSKRARRLVGCCIVLGKALVKRLAPTVTVYESIFTPND